jgi:hypothetical protein
MRDDGRRRRRGLRRTPATVWSTEYLMQITVMGLERWDRLTREEQERFQALATRAGDQPKANLSGEEQKELGTLWKRLNPRELLRDAIRLAIHGERA